MSHLAQQSIRINLVVTNSFLNMDTLTGSLITKRNMLSKELIFIPTQSRDFGVFSSVGSVVYILISARNTYRIMLMNTASVTGIEISEMRCFTRCLDRSL